MSAKTVNLCSPKKCKYCLQTKDLRKLGQNYRVKGKLVNYSQMLADCFPTHWSPSNHDGYLCLWCIPKLRAAYNLRKMILKSRVVLNKNVPEKCPNYDDAPMTDDVRKLHKNLSKHDHNQVKNCNENLDNTSHLQEKNGYGLFGFPMDETPIVKVEDEKSYTDSELILIESHYECNQESDQEIKDIPTPICEVETEYAHLEFMERSSSVYMDLEFNKDENIQDQSNIKDVALEVIPNSEEDILILKVEEQEPINETISEPIYTNCEPIDSNCEQIDSDCEVDRMFDTVISQLNQSDLVEYEQNNEDIIVLQVGGQSSHVEVLENDILEQNIDDESTNNMEPDDGGHELKSKKDNGLKNKISKKCIKTRGTTTFTDDQLKEAVTAIQEGRLSVTQAVLRLRTNFNSFYKKTTELLGFTFPRKDKKWDYRGYFREIVTILNTTNCSPFKSRGNYIYCAYCCPKKQDGIGYTPDQLREHVKAQHPAPTFEDVKGFMYPFNKHEIIHLDIADLECRKCALKIDSWSDLLNHLKDIHGKEIKDGAKRIIPYILHHENMTCNLCTETFSSWVKLECHMNVHYPNYLCNECGLHLASKLRLNGHKNKHHNHYKTKSKSSSTKVLVYCDKCGHDFCSKQELRNHIYRHHNKTVTDHSRICTVRARSDPYI